MLEPVVYLNDRFVAQKDAVLPVYDRSILFSDSVYEVICFIDGVFLDFFGHAERLKSSLKKLDIAYSFDAAELLALHKELVRRNGVATGSVYLQVSRGVTERNFYYDNTVAPSFFMFVQAVPREKLFAPRLLKMVSVPEGRWAYRDIKTTQLLYSSLVKTPLPARGIDDAVYVEDGFITEATSSNFHIIDKEGVFVTRPLDRSILPGITRHTLIEIAKREGLRVVERLFTVEEAQEAREVFISSATTFATSVGWLDGKAIAGGQAGPLVQKLRALYFKHVPRA